MCATLKPSQAATSTSASAIAHQPTQCHVEILTIAKCTQYRYPESSFFWVSRHTSVTGIGLVTRPPMCSRLPRAAVLACVCDRPQLSGLPGLRRCRSLHCAVAQRGRRTIHGDRQQQQSGCVQGRTHLLAVERPVNGDDARLRGQVAVHAAAHRPEVDFVVVRHRDSVADGLARRRRLAAGPGDCGARMLAGAAAVAEVRAGVVTPARRRRVTATGANAWGRCMRLCTRYIPGNASRRAAM